MARERPPIYLRRKGRFLVAGDAPTEAFIETLPQDKLLRAQSITQPRSRPRLRLYWALIHLVADNLENVPALGLHEWVKMRLGIVVSIPLKSGKVDLVPGSVSFESMGEEDFAPYLDQTIDLLVSHVIPGLNRNDLLDMAREMIGEKSS